MKIHPPVRSVAFALFAMVLAWVSTSPLNAQSPSLDLKIDMPALNPSVSDYAVQADVAFKVKPSVDMWIGLIVWVGFRPVDVFGEGSGLLLPANGMSLPSLSNMYDDYETDHSWIVPIEFNPANPTTQLNSTIGTTFGTSSAPVLDSVTSATIQFQPLNSSTLYSMPAIYNLMSPTHLANHMLSSFTTPNVSGWDFHAADNANQFYTASPNTYRTWSIPQTLAFSNDLWKSWNKALRYPNKTTTASSDPTLFNVARLREFAILNASGSQSAASSFINSATGIYGQSANSTAMFLGIQAIGFYPSAGFSINSEGMPSNQNPSPSQIRAVLSPLCIVDFAARLAYYAEDSSDGGGGGGGGPTTDVPARKPVASSRTIGSTPTVTNNTGLWISNFSGLHLTLLDAVYPLTLDVGLAGNIVDNWDIQWTGIGEAGSPDSYGRTIGTRVNLAQIYDPLTLVNGLPAPICHLGNRVLSVEP